MLLSRSRRTGAGRSEPARLRHPEDDPGAHHLAPTRLEALMGEHGGIGAVIAGAALAARSTGPTSDVVHAALRETGADVAGQCLTAFLLWVRDTCEEASVTHVAFLARDGELPLRMAQAMPADHWQGFDLQYLQGTRRLWSVAAAAVIGVPEWLDAGTAEETSFIRYGQHDIPWSALLGRVSLGAGDLAGHPVLAALPPDRPLPVDLDDEWRSLLADPGARDTISVRANEQYANVRQHLEGVGITSSRGALVDVGWRGQLAWHISAVLRAVTGDEPMHLHFGGANTSPEAYLVDLRRFAVDDRVAPPPFFDIVSCVETFTASGHARARALERDPGGNVRVVYAEASAEMDTAERRLLWKAAVAVAGNMPSRAEMRQWPPVDDHVAEGVRAVLSAFWLAPSPTHALAAANLAAEVDDVGVGIEVVASPYRLRGLGTASRTWRHGSLRLTPPWLRHPLRLLFALRAAKNGSR